LTSYANLLTAVCSPVRSKNDLAKQLAELKQELLTLRVQKIAGGSASKLTKM
jgi:large subunit ribosomal protein L35e